MFQLHTKQASFYPLPFILETNCPTKKISYKILVETKKKNGGKYNTPAGILLRMNGLPRIS